jgi:hypothetical protein
MKRAFVVFLLASGCTTAEPTSKPGPMANQAQDPDPGSRNDLHCFETPSAPESDPPRMFVNVYARGDDLLTVVDKLGASSGITIGLDSNVSSKPVTLTLRHVHWREALGRVAESAGCEVTTIEEGKSYFVRAR